MRPNIELDEQLINEALSLSSIKTKQELVNQALKEFVEHRKLLHLSQLKGMGGFGKDYDHKSLR